MNNLKSHIVFTKQQRYGIFLLLLIICLLQGLYFFLKHPKQEIQIIPAQLQAFQKEMDSLKAVQKASKFPELFPFNPNFITDYKGYVLGMSEEEIDRLLHFRKQNKWINSVEDFKTVTEVSDSLLEKISPFFIFPEWVNQKETSTEVYRDPMKKNYTYKEKIDLNTAISEQLQTVYGVGEILAGRIVKLRDSFEGGFISEVQLTDVYGLSPEVIQNIKKRFAVKTPRRIIKGNLNVLSVSELVKIQHIDYPLASEIVEYRTLHEGFKSLDELLKVNTFPAAKLDIIKLYLALN